MISLLIFAILALSSFSFSAFVDSHPTVVSSSSSSSLSSSSLLSSSLSSLPLLPLPSHDIPSSLSPPLSDGRVSVHGWLFLPLDRTTSSSSSSSSSSIVGWFYHHTPEMYHTSPHDFELMILGELTLSNFSVIDLLPLPPTFERLGTEYVFTPPEFSLDELILSTLPPAAMNGRFTNGSFDTPQRYLLSPGHLRILNVSTVHYLDQYQQETFTELTYLSYPRSPFSSATEVNTLSQHFYLIHLLESMPEFDQTIHIRLNLSDCLFIEGDGPLDVMSTGATWVARGVKNEVENRLLAKEGEGESEEENQVLLELRTERTKGMEKFTTCEAVVVEEIHCVTVPDSFAKCPPTLRGKQMRRKHQQLKQQ